MRIANKASGNQVPNEGAGLSYAIQARMVRNKAVETICEEIADSLFILLASK